LGSKAAKERRGRGESRMVQRRKLGFRQIHAVISKDLFIRLRKFGLFDEKDFDSFVESALEAKLQSCLEGTGEGQ